MLEIKPDTPIALTPSIVLHSLPSRNFYYAFDVESGEQYKLNMTSFWVLEKISARIEWSELKESFLNTFEVSPEQAQMDLIALINDLSNQHLVRSEENGKD
jgi:hypothetical protein